MLSVKNVTKIYSAPGGASVRALDGVTLDFPERGMVFLLGRSGSGKSTLLNVAGGLDAPDSGEIVVKGRSSADFSREDFDSYRNTFVGFVFQEYNLLEEFTVAENIALAPELQGRTPAPEEIRALLESVELGDVADRRPNTLSGGQRQRVAIARALVKNPEIIMADEPTGALDSNTGRQVLETLHALSAEKLVLVVSHDREFAERYGDRIVELEDGKVISDRSRHTVPPRTEGEHVTCLGEETLSVQNGVRLSEEELSRLADFIAEAKSPVLISRSETDVAAFRAAARLTETGEREEFRPSEPEPPRKFAPEESRFIRSRLPLRHAARIGASGLRVKPVRLLMTILLSTIAFSLFGLAATMMQYREANALQNALNNAQYQGYKLEKKASTDGVREGEVYFTYEEPAHLSAAEGAAEAASLGVNGLPGCRFDIGTRIDIRANLSADPAETDAGDFAYICGFVPADAAALRNFGVTLIAGEWPAAPDEICLSSVVLETFRNGGWAGNGEVTAVRTEKDLIGRTIVVEDYPLRVCGIFDAGISMERYEAIRGLSREEVYSRDLGDALSLWETDYECTAASMALVSKDFYAEYAGRFGVSTANRFADGYSQYAEGTMRAGAGRITSPLAYLELSEAEGEIVGIDGPVSALSEGQAVLSEELMMDLVSEALFNTKDGDVSETVYKAYEDLFYAETAETHAAAMATIREAMDASCGAGWRTVEIEAGARRETLTAVGFARTDVRRDHGLYLAKGLTAALDADGASTRLRYVTRYAEGSECIYDFLLLPGDTSKSALVARHAAERDERDVTWALNCDVVQEVEEISEFVRLVRNIFLWIGSVLAVFAALLLFNFISASIAYKRREIGILRAVGARGADVFRIFFSESAIIAAACTVLACVLTAIVAALINAETASALGLHFSLFLFGPLQALCIALIAALVAVCATWLPVSLAARRSPVEAIRSL